MEVTVPLIYEEGGGGGEGGRVQPPLKQYTNGTYKPRNNHFRNHGYSITVSSEKLMSKYLNVNTFSIIEIT